MSKPFKFKLFSVHQDQCAMKIGTDGVLLGAWTSIDKRPFAILDIGSGTGLIALMMAQRSDADMIDAIEIDGDAYEQSVENFESSPWADRLYCYHAGLDEFVDELDEKYDLIISNPPFIVKRSQVAMTPVIWPAKTALYPLKNYWMASVNYWKMKGYSLRSFHSKKRRPS